jgi:hypothetical protein
LVVVGDGDFRAESERVVQEQGVAQRTIFTGAIYDGVAKYFQLAEVVVQPGMGGLVVSEAMAHGRPIVTSVGDGSELDLVRDGYNGYSISDSGDEELADALRKVLDSPEKAQTMGRHGRQLIDDDYNIDRYFNELLASIYFAHERHHPQRVKTFLTGRSPAGRTTNDSPNRRQIWQGVSPDQQGTKPQRATLITDIAERIASRLRNQNSMATTGACAFIYRPVGANQYLRTSTPLILATARSVQTHFHRTSCHRTRRDAKSTKQFVCIASIGHSGSAARDVARPVSRNDLDGWIIISINSPPAQVLRLQRAGAAARSGKRSRPRHKTGDLTLTLGGSRVHGTKSTAFRRCGDLRAADSPAVRGLKRLSISPEGATTFRRTGGQVCKRSPGCTNAVHRIPPATQMNLPRRSQALPRDPCDPRRPRWTGSMMRARKIDGFAAPSSFAGWNTELMMQTVPPRQPASQIRVSIRRHAQQISGSSASKRGCVHAQENRVSRRQRQPDALAMMNRRSPSTKNGMRPHRGRNSSDNRRRPRPPAGIRTNVRKVSAKLCTRKEETGAVFVSTEHTEREGDSMLGLR